MRAFPQTVSISSSTETALANGVEAVIVTTPPIATQAEGGLVIFDGSLQCLLAAAVTSFQLRIRRASLTGAAVFTGQAVNVTASTTIALPFNGEDRPGEVAGQLYVVTATVVGGTATMKFITANLSY